MKSKHHKLWAIKMKVKLKKMKKKFYKFRKIKNKIQNSKLIISKLKIQKTNKT